MSNSRRHYNNPTHLSLLDEVGSACPKCTVYLFRRKGKSDHKNYELAHIYPLNATPAEQLLLKNEERLSQDVNHPNNIIALCQACHDELDNPRTVEEYRELVDFKKNCIEKNTAKKEWRAHPLEKEISIIIDALYQEKLPHDDCHISYNPKTIENKVGNHLDLLTKRKIQAYVLNYFSIVKKHLSNADQKFPNVSEHISQQIRIHYLALQKQGVSKQVIFDSLSGWVKQKTGLKSIDAPEIIVAFFIQNCEVFEDASK